jgi:glucose/arabinose dehydrogenase
MRRLLPVVVALSFVVLACGGSDAGDTRRPRSATTTASTAPASTTSTIPPNGDLAAANVTFTKVADVTSGTALTHRPGEPGVLYVARQGGQVVAVRDGQVDPTPTLDLAGRLVSGGEQGLLGIAFSPDGSKLYAHFTGTGGESRLEEYTMAGAVADPASAREVLTAPGLQPNHNGGAVTFGPDGNLYLGLGDGGAANDSGAGHAPEGNGQSLQTLLGKILRIDPTPAVTAGYTIPSDNPYVSGGGLPEIWVSGLRNPWRFSFDSATGDLWIGDVGQNAWEEVDRVPFDVANGANFGWPLLEGSRDFRGGAIPGTTVLPVLETSHADGNCAITGGYVYRGSAISALFGSYLFTDNCNGAIRAIQLGPDGAVAADRELGTVIPGVSSFGEDANGELYVVSQSQGIFRVDAA